jgi:uncharacterized protein YndB with AHSA1/START domain
MRTVQIEKTLRAPIERVFDVLADHAGYVHFPGVKSAKVVRPGAPDPNGVGAVREIDVGLAWFREEVTAFERPIRMAYQIVHSRPPLVHDGGSITLTATPEGTHVSWVTTFRVALPLIGGLATAIAARQMTRDFARALDAVEQRAR